MEKNSDRVGKGRYLHMPWHVYILKCGDGSLYTGITNSLKERVKKHNAGTGAKYTRSRLPVKLIYRETSKSRSAALTREIAIKKLPRKEKLQLVRRRKLKA